MPSIPTILTTLLILTQARALAAPQPQPHANLTLSASSPYNNNTTTLHDTQRLASDPGTTWDTTTIVGTVAGVILILSAAGVLFWCGRKARYPGLKRKGGKKGKGRGERQQRDDDASEMV